MIAQGFGSINHNVRRLARDNGLMQEVAFGAGRDNLTRYSPPQSLVTSHQGDRSSGSQNRKLKKRPTSTISLSLGECTFIPQVVNYDGKQRGHLITRSYAQYQHASIVTARLRV